MAERNKQVEPCEFDGCERVAKTRGWCNAHYEQWRKGKPQRPLRDRAADGTWGQECRVHKCHRPQRARGYCSTHLWQLTYSKGKIIRPVRVMQPGEWSAWSTTKDGYVTRWRWLPDKSAAERQLQHRVAMEEHIGRPLRPEETVHHINGVRDQNNIENLELWSSAHPGGQRVIDKLKWAYELIALYDPDGQLAPGAPGSEDGIL